jgi:phage baseplate assembly protein W
MNRDGDFIGRGWTFPARIGKHGGVRLAGGAEELDGALRMILATSPGERVLRPDFGCAMWQQVFAPLDANTLGLIEQAVREAVGRWEPRVEVEVVRALAGDDGTTVQIELTYRVRATNDHRNLVYPFYVIPYEEPEP